MAEALAPADLEAVVVGLLAGPVSTKIPNPRPAEFTRVTRAGGAPINLVQSNARLLVECFADDSVSAFDRARAAWAALWAAQRSTVGGAWIARVEMTEPVNFPDDITGLARYQFVAQLTASLTPVEVP